MLAAAFTLTFFGFLRISEFAVPSKSKFDPRKHPTRCSISWKEDHYTFKIVSSKTDQLGHGHKLITPRSRNGVCPFSAMYKYLQHSTCNHSSGPLFQFHNGQPLTRFSSTSKASCNVLATTQSNSILIVSELAPLHHQRKQASHLI